MLTTGGFSGVKSLFTSSTEKLCTPGVTFVQVWFSAAVVTHVPVAVTAGLPGLVGAAISMK